MAEDKNSIFEINIDGLHLRAVMNGQSVSKQASAWERWPKDIALEPKEHQKIYADYKKLSRSKFCCWWIFSCLVTTVIVTMRALSNVGPR